MGAFYFKALAAPQQLLANTGQWIEVNECGILQLNGVKRKSENKSWERDEGGRGRRSSAVQVQVYK